MLHNPHGTEMEKKNVTLQMMIFFSLFGTVERQNNKIECHTILFYIGIYIYSSQEKKRKCYKGEERVIKKKKSECTIREGECKNTRLFDVMKMAWNTCALDLFFFLLKFD